MIGFFFGLFVGLLAGIFLMALTIASSDADDAMEDIGGIDSFWPESEEDE